MLFRPLLPPEILLAEAALADRCDADGHQSQPLLHPEEENLAATLRGSRRDEFRAGRHLIRRLLRDSGSAPPPPVLPDSEGAPIWPAGFRGSITHHAGRIAVGLASIETSQEFGIDLVSLSDPLPPDDILHPGEKERFSTAATELGRIQRHLAWGVKEAVAKALGTKLFPLDRFAEAEIEPASGTVENQSWRGQVKVSDLRPRLDFRARRVGSVLAVAALVAR
jgi:enterobactin synthetase component D / holo-[acyl-carrier protein] synthase